MIVLRKKSGSESERSGRICVLVGCGMGNHESMGGTRGRKEEPGAKKREVNARSGRRQQARRGCSCFAGAE